MSRLGTGLLHHTYRVERGGRAFSMRIAATDQPGLGGDGAWELEVLRHAAQRGLAAQVVYGDPERGILVQEWVAGRSWPASAAREPANIARMADLLRRVHELPRPAAARSMDARAWIEHYGAALAAAPGAPAAGLARLGAAADGRLARLEMQPEPARVVCHSDLHLMNLVECPPEGGSRPLKLLDWEYAHVAEPFWDVAGWGANNDFPAPLLHALLGAYLGRTPQEAEWARCTQLCWLYDYVCLLWSQLYLDARPGTAAQGIAARAALLNERLAVD